MKITWTLLKYILKTDDDVLLKQTINSGVNICENAENRYSLNYVSYNDREKYPIICIFENNCVKCIDVIYNNKINLNIYHKNDKSYTNTPLYCTFKNNDLFNFKKLINKNIYANSRIKKINSHHEFIETNVLNMICSHSLIDVCTLKFLKIMINDNFDINIYNNIYIRSLIHTTYSDQLLLHPIIGCLLSNNKPKCAQFLIDSGMNINCKITLFNNTSSLYDVFSRLTYRVNFTMFFVKNGLNTDRKNPLVINACQKIKSSFMISISHIESKHSISNFFKLNIGLKSFIGRKIIGFFVM